jgi:hypothetical protein
MELHDIRKLWNDYQYDLNQMTEKLSTMYGMPIFLLGRSVECFFLGGLLITLLILVGVQL